MTSPSDIVVDRPSPGVLAITLNRPDALNALRNALLAELAATLDAAAGDDAG